MTTLAANLSDSATEMRVNAPVTDPAEYYQIDDEIIWVAAVTTTVNATLSPNRTVDTTLWQIKERGVSTSAPASHTSGATVTPLVLGATSGGGLPSGGVERQVLTKQSASDGDADWQAPAVFQTATVTLTDAQIKALGGDILELIAAPGPAKQIVPLTIVLRLNTNAGASTNVTDPRPFTFLVGLRWGTYIPTYFLTDQGPAQLVHVGPGTFWNGTFEETDVQEGGDVADGVNQPLHISGNNGVNGDFTGGNAANSMKITVLYAVIDV